VLTVAVELPGRARPLTCASGLDDLAVGERVLIEADGRTHFGVVVRGPADQPWSEGALRPRVLARATANDEDRESHLQRQREDSLATARRQVEDLKLPMRLLRAEPAPVGRKLTIQFVADGRVDFRELVRDLARRLKARVELRQIGVRDAAVIQGGVGHCGQRLCCASWLPGFAPVSMRMAKAQGLPLNPSKISGQCGRLMCCLRYEMGGNEPASAGGGAENSEGSSGAADPGAPPEGGPMHSGHRPCCRQSG
jgi:cell fate regulator YaaT (PSP1 superfamily)